MKKKNVFMFSGQGSQYYQMGRGLYENETQFRRWMDDLDQHAQRILGVSIVDILYAADKKVHHEFIRTLYTNPAIFMVESALAHTLIDSGIQPDLVLGTSMGEFAAATIAGVMGHEKALELVIKQAKCIEHLCEPGSVIAIFEKPELYQRVEMLRKNSALVAINGDSHFVISGSAKELADIRDYLSQHNIMHQTLPVSHGFHSANIDPAFHSFDQLLSAEQFENPQTLFVSALQGRIVHEFQVDYFWEIVREPIRFGDALASLAPDDGPYNYIDLGPTGTLANFTRHYHAGADPRSEIFPVMTQYRNELENLRTVKKKICIRDKIRNPKKKTHVAYVFPGQGSQKRGMGEALFDQYPDLTKKADAILEYSIKELCVKDPENKLNHTQFTQPALYVVNALSYLSKRDQQAGKPDYVAGHSLGEYNALFAAGAMDFETGLKLVKKRGELMAVAIDGGMAAVIGMTEQAVVDTITNHKLISIDIANLNSPTQFVISGPRDDILNAQPIFETAGCTLYIPLNVSGAFHSRLMSDAGHEFGTYIQQFTFGDIQIPVVSNVLARPYPRDNIRQLLIDQITKPVRWTDSVRYMLRKGVGDFVEIGPGTVLMKLIKAIR